ncbi:unnamed protein product, partial [Ectocarpus fasciculatus]
MGFLVRSASIACGFTLFSQLLQVAAQTTCDVINVLGGTGGCDGLGCTAKDVTLGGLSGVEPVDQNALCDSTTEIILLTGDLTFQSSMGGRQDIGMWVDRGGQCLKYGFECADPAPALDIDGDVCADADGSGDFIFEGVEFTAPCKANGDGNLVVDFCISWKTTGQDNPNVNDACTSAEQIFPGSEPKCTCGSEEVVDIKVCPEPNAISVVTASLATTATQCLGDGTEFDIVFAGIPTTADVAYTITPEAEDTTVDYSVNGFVTGGSLTQTLYPNVVNTIVLEISYAGVGPVCNSVTLEFTPTCSCQGPPPDCPPDLICCDDKDFCDVPGDEAIDGTVCGDPHMTGFLGQKFDFTGEDGEWYSVIADSNMHVNMRVTSPVADLPEITYITGLSVLTTDSDGSDHSIVIEVADPHSLDSSCPAGVSPCLADGALIVLVDGEEVLLSPGTISLGPDVEVSAVNLPGACRSFGFEKYWERKKRENASQGRRLGTPLSMGEWILGDPTATNMNECAEYVTRAEVEAGGVFAHQSEHASFQIVTPKAIIRLSHGRLHQIAMRDPTDRFDLPDHLTWQMNMAIDHTDVSHAAKGILGQTFVPTRDADGKPIMTGFESIRGTEED